MPDNSQSFDLRSFTKKQICEIIEAMDLEKNSRLPSEARLAEMLQVSRDTIRVVLTDLASEGRIIRRHGYGTFVNTFAGDIRATLFPSMQYYWDIIKNYGYKPSIKLISLYMQAEDKYVASCLRLPAKTKLVRLERAYCANGQPCIVCIDYFNRQIIADMESFHPQAQCSIFQILYDAAGFTVVWSKAGLKATSTDMNPELVLPFSTVEGQAKPLMQFNSICYDKKDTPFLYTESYFDSDLIEFSYIQQYGAGRKKDNMDG